MYGMCITACPAAVCYSINFPSSLNSTLRGRSTTLNSSTERPSLRHERYPMPRHGRFVELSVPIVASRPHRHDVHAHADLLDGVRLQIKWPPRLGKFCTGEVISILQCSCSIVTARSSQQMDDTQIEPRRPSGENVSPYVCSVRGKRRTTASAVCALELGPWSDGEREVGMYPPYIAPSRTLNTHPS